MEKILDNEYYDFIISTPRVPTFDTGDRITMLNDMYSLIHVHKDNMEPCDLGRYPYEDFPALFTLASRISSQKSESIFIPRHSGLNLYGMDVITGIVDTGIDYRHPAFKNPDGTTRIIAIWDQTIQDGKPPQGFSFGTEYGKNHINTALKSSDPISMVPTTDTIGHGTAIASIICGSPDQEHSFSGIVPQAKLAVVKLKEAKQNLKDIFFVPENALCYQESDIILGIRYLFSLSQKLNRPLVLCIGLGSSQGGHDGLGALSQYLDHLVYLPTTSVSIAAGNDGNNGRHYFHSLKESPSSDEFYLNVGENDTMFSMEIWPFPFEKITMELISPDHETIQNAYYPYGHDCQRFSFNCCKTSVWINNIILDKHTGDQFILVRIDGAIPGVWTIRIKSIENQPLSFHAWLPSGNLISYETCFLHSSPDTTVTAPGNAGNPLTVTAFNQHTGAILEESGKGYTRSGRIVPDIAAPGYHLPWPFPRASTEA